MTDQAFGEVKRREIKRFHGAVDTVVENLLLKKYEDTRSAEEFRDYSRICGLVKTNLQTIDLIADKMGPLFERTNERSNWEVYLTGLRKMVRGMPQSYLFRFVLPMLGLEALRERLSAYSVKCLDQFHAAHKTFQAVDTYVHNLAAGQSIAREYQNNHGDLPRLYSSIKTWESDGDLERYFGELKEFLDLSVEVFVAGPIQLYLMIGKDTFLAIFKGLTVGKLSDLQLGDREYSEMLRLHDFVHGSAASSKTLEIVQVVARDAVSEYTTRLRQEQQALRAQVPTRDMRRRFVHRYEGGALFRPELD